MSPVPLPTVLGIDCPFDDITTLASDTRARSGGVYDYIRGPQDQRRFNVNVLTDPQRQDFETDNNNSVVYITGVGHGPPDGRSYLRSTSESLITVGAYPFGMFQRKIVHLFSCFDAIALGPDLVSNGCIAFFGYNAQFTFPNISQDTNTAGIFIQCDEAIDRAIADGLTPQAAYNSAKEVFQNASAALSPADAATLATNFAALRLLLPMPAPAKWYDWTSQQPAVAGPTPLIVT